MAPGWPVAGNESALVELFALLLNRGGTDQFHPAQGGTRRSAAGLVSLIMSFKPMSLPTPARAAGGGASQRPGLLRPR